MYSTIMADKRFNIENECLSYNLSMYIPPVKWGTYQIVPCNFLRQKNCKHAHIS